MLSITSTVLVVGALLGAAAGASTCAADNCLRAVRASAFPTRMGTADCSSYFMVTVTPATSVIVSKSTSIALTTTTTVIPAAVRRRAGGGAARAAAVEVRQVTISASSIPAYASACSGAARYSSACSCIGVTKTTITAAAPLTTTTTTTTATSVITSTSTIPVAPVPPTLEVLNYADGGCQVPDSPPSMTITNGQCVYLSFQISDNYGVGSFNPGTCSTTAADCTVSYFFDGGCNDFAQANTADSTACVYVGDIFSMQMICPSC